MPVDPEIAGVLVGYRGPIQRHVLIPASQCDNGELIARYITRIHLQLSALGVKPYMVQWAVLPTKHIMRSVSGKDRVWIPPELHTPINTTNF